MPDRITRFNIDFSFRGKDYTVTMDREDVGLTVIYFILKTDPYLDGVDATFFFYFDEVCTSTLPENIKAELSAILRNKIDEHFEQL